MHIDNALVIYSSEKARCSPGNKNLGSEDLDLTPHVIFYKSLHLYELQVTNLQNEANDTCPCEIGVSTKCIMHSGMLDGVPNIVKTGSAW